MSSVGIKLKLENIKKEESNDWNSKTEVQRERERELFISIAAKMIENTVM